MTSNDDGNIQVRTENNACSSLRDALQACNESNHQKVEEEFNRFIAFLKKHKISEALPYVKGKQSPIRPSNFITHEASAQSHKIYPTDAIPLDLVALADCLNAHDLSKYAENAVTAVIDIISEDDKLAFLRQNTYQEVARYFARRGKYREADKLFLEQLAIVSAKGSKVLHDFVKINRLINLGNDCISNSQFDDANTSFLNALLLIEASAEKHPDQIVLLYEGWSKLDDLSTAQSHNSQNS